MRLRRPGGLLKGIRGDAVGSRIMAHRGAQPLFHICMNIEHAISPDTDTISQIGP